MTANKLQHTHRVSVNAYLIRNDKFLLLKRAHDPKIWTPPGGRLRIDEDPEEGLIRELKEETNLDVDVIAPVNTWFGFWKTALVLSIDYLVYSKTENITLSREHNNSCWVSLKELENGYPVKLHARLGFGLTDFRRAWKIHLLSTSDSIEPESMSDLADQK